MAHSGFPLTMSSCPECRTRLDAPLYDAEACPGGHGVHLSRSGQERALPRRAQDAIATAEPVTDHDERACPSCATPMRAVRVATREAPLLLDRCICGSLWFDGDELVRITRAHRTDRPAWSARDPRHLPTAVEILLWSFA